MELAQLEEFKRRQRRISDDIKKAVEVFNRAGQNVSAEDKETLSDKEKMLLLAYKLNAMVTAARAIYEGTLHFQYENERFMEAMSEETRNNK